MAERQGDVLRMERDRTSGIYTTSAPILAVMLECWDVSVIFYDIPSFLTGRMGIGRNRDII